MAACDRIFLSVFPPSSEISVPTPTSTPLLPSDSFSDSNPRSLPQRPPKDAGGSAAEQIKWDRAWHTATSFLTIPNEPIAESASEQRVDKRWFKGCDTETRKAFEYVLNDDSKGRKARAGKEAEDLVRWYFEVEVLGHFMNHMLPVLTGILNEGSTPDELLEVGKHLYLAQMVYLHPMKSFIQQHVGPITLKRFERDLHGLFIHTLPREKIENGLAHFFRHQASLVLDIDRQRYAPRYARIEVLDPKLIAREMEKTCSWMEALQGVGLGGQQAQRIFAEIMSEMLGAHIEAVYSRRWETPSRNKEFLHAWIESDFATFIAKVLAKMTDEPLRQGSSLKRDDRVNTERWRELAISKLGILRTEELFDVVVAWDDTIHGAIEDLKLYVKSPASRNYLTTSFSMALGKRLLQPGASTTEILQVYISIIRAFTMLDAKGVLLDRVARPIRRYLRERDNTVTIVVGGLLADPDDDSNTDDVLIELAVEMANHSNSMDVDSRNGELDFDDMQWMPDPVDAGPDYKKSKHSDVIGSLISLFESQEAFIKEFQSILGERLLKKEYDFDREVRVLELLKLRFGESPLQACEVMLRDILDSRRLDASIQKDQRFHGGAMGVVPALHARVLSHLFWPSLHSDSFAVPPAISKLQASYAKGFESIKNTRKLTWLHALGQVTVSLDLEDRTVTEEVQTWQASVIYAFQSDDVSDSSSQPIIRTVPELVQKLEMAEHLVLNALTFWIGKLVLKALPSPPHPPRSFTVLETLADEAAAQEGTASAAIAAAAETVTSAAAPAVLSEQEMVREKMEVYSQYVVGMLTNGGAMPLQQIVMMLKLTVPGGFPFGNEELKGFLEGEVRGGRLGYEGGNYKIKH